MPGREAMSVSKAKKRFRSDQRLDVELPPAQEGGLMIHLFGIQAMYQGIRVNLVHLVWSRRFCIWHHITLRGRRFFLLLRSSRPPFEAFAARTWSHHHLAPSEHPCNRQGQTSQTSHCRGTQASWQPAHMPCLCIGPVCPGNPVAGMGELQVSL